MRVASGVLGGIGALLGMKSSVLFVAGLVLAATDPSGRGFSNPLLSINVGSEGGITLFCVVGMVGAGLAFAGRSRTAAWLMLTGAVGVTLSAVAYDVLQSIIVESIAGSSYEPLVTGDGWYSAQVFPAPPLFLGVVLAFLARGRSVSSGEAL